MRGSERTWKVWGNEFCLVPRLVDLRIMDDLPLAFRQVFQLSAEDWDGLPNRRDAMISALSEVGNVVAITGDIHAFFAGTPWVRGEPAKKVVEFVTAAISSSSYKTLLARSAAADPGLAAAGAEGLAQIVDFFLQHPVTKPNPHLAHSVSDHHGFSVARADADTFEVTYYAIPERFAARDLGTGEDLDGKFETTKLVVQSGSAELFKDNEGTLLQWDPAAAAWV
jgi:alkaline phosphatase D